MAKKDKLKGFKKCFDKEVDKHLKKKEDLFKKDIKTITNRCLKKVKLKAK